MVHTWSPFHRLPTARSVCSKHLGFVGLFEADLFGFGLLLLLFFLILAKLTYFPNLSAQLYWKDKVKESLLVLGAGNRELFSL